MTQTLLRAVLALTLFVTVTAVHAQGGGETMAKKMTDRMKERLPLADSIEYQKMYDLNLKYINRQQDVLQGNEGRMAKFKALKGLQDKKSQEAKTLLSKEQYKNYQALVAEMREEMMEKYRDRKNP
ncbi:MAG: hypothetical protein JST39_02455 [Bacteroidetes bacterium]|nr:hypothetical protein [Bacteroidota bacterium]